MGLTASVMTGAVRVAFYFDLLQIGLQQVEIFLHEFLKYRLLIKIGPGTVGDIDCIWHLFVTLFLMFVRTVIAVNANNLRMQV
jgi:hypothetical protein